MLGIETLVVAQLVGVGFPMIPGVTMMEVKGVSFKLLLVKAMSLFLETGPARNDV